MLNLRAFFFIHMGNRKPAIAGHRLNRSAAGHSRPTYARTIVLINRSTRAHGRTNGVLKGVGFLRIFHFIHS